MGENVSRFTYPCPGCGGEATVDEPCPGCGRAPDANAAAVIRLDGEIAELAPRAEQARQSYQALAAQLIELRRQREMHATAVRAARRVERANAEQARPAAPDPAGLWGRPEAPQGVRQPEASARTVQNVLFVLGGLLLGTAAIVFTVVAWAAYGVAVRAGILSALTVAALAVPPLVRRRGLHATAETFAALGLLLVLLDGWAAWYVDLFGVADHWHGGVYAGAVLGATAALAYGYARAVGVQGPRFAALALAQPVLPLLFADSSLGRVGWLLVLVAVVAGNVAALWALRGPALWALRGPLRVAAWLAFAGSLAVASIAALIAWAAPDSEGIAWSVAGAVLLLTALLVAAAWIGGDAGLRLSTAFAVPFAVVAALLRPLIGLWPDHWFLIAAVAAVLVAVASSALVRRDPSGWRAGAGFGAGGIALLAWLVGAAQAAVLTVRAIIAATPWWHAAPEGFESPYDWSLPLGLVLVTAAAWLAVGSAAAWTREWRPRELVLAAGAVMLAVTLPDHPAITPWAPLAVTLAVSVACALTAVRGATPARTPVWGCAAGLLAGLTLLLGAGTPARSAVSLGGVMLVALAAALAAARSAGARHRLGAVGATVAVLLLPLFVQALLTVAGLSDVQVSRGTLLALLVTPVLVAVAPVGYRALLAPSVAVLSWYTLLPWAEHGVQPRTVYAALGALIAVAAVLPRRPYLGSLAWLALPPALVALAFSSPSLAAVLVEPYTWLTRVWSGHPVRYVFGPDILFETRYAQAAALVILIAAFALARRPAGWRTALTEAAALLVLPVLTVLGAAGAPWPVVPAATLAAGLALLLVAAIAPLRTSSALLLGLLGVLLTPAGLCELAVEKWSTITGLAAAVVALAAIAVAGRRTWVKVAGWLAGALGKVLLALTVGAVADLPAQTTAYLVLLAAAVALGVAHLPVAPAVRVAAEASAHATALVALTLAAHQPRPSAGVLALWGIAVGLTVLGERDAGRRLLRAGAACLLEAVAWWLLLGSAQVGTVEAYTLPVAALALGVGLVAFRRRPELSSWLLFGAALAGALLPSLAVALATDGSPWRRLLLGLAALAVVLIGASRRLQAPVMLGGGTLLVLALDELVRLSRQLPTWIPLAAAGAIILALAITYERSRRDLRRLGGALGRMR